MRGTIRLEKSGRIAQVILCNPERLNAMTRAMWRELRSVFEALQADRDCRCVVVRGEGSAFCAGGDISEYPSFRFEETTLRAFHEDDVWGGLAAMLACDVPLVAQIEGACMGAGMEISSCCDIRIASDSAKFGAPIAKLGFPMAPREAQLVARAAGELTAREMLLGAAVFSSDEMKLRGFLSRVCSASDTRREVEHIAQRVASLAPQAARLNKQTLRTLARGELALEGAYRYADSAEHREGIAAFLEKRNPHFQD